MKKYVLFLTMLMLAACSWSHPTGSTTANRRCNTFTQWDDCAKAVNCIHARAWYTSDGEYRETFVCIEKWKKANASR